MNILKKLSAEVVYSFHKYSNIRIFSGQMFSVQIIVTPEINWMTMILNHHHKKQAACHKDFKNNNKRNLRVGVQVQV